MEKKPIYLHFDPAQSHHPDGKKVRDGLSAALCTGKNLWVSCDERHRLERLTRTGPDTFAEHRTFDLNDFLDLPANGPCEIDIEGLALGQGYLWLVGSHSLARKKPRKQDPPEKQMTRLAKLKDDPNRYLLARIPLLREEETGQYTLAKEAPHPDDPTRRLTAAQLKMTEKGNQIMELMREDVHFRDFMRIPGKDNGFDLEGIAVSGERIFLGVRGPVLRGWAAILEIQVQEQDEAPGYFALRKVEGQFYRKHFLHLEGMGVRELRLEGEDLLILAGPTMDLDGTIAVYRWPQGGRQEQECVVHRKELERLFEVPHGTGATSRQDKAEGMALMDDNHVLIVFDSPSEARKIGDDQVVADSYALPAG